MLQSVQYVVVEAVQPNELVTCSQH